MGKSVQRKKNSKQHDYIIRGGFEGRERLRVLSRVMQPTTLALFQRAGVRPGLQCLDVGCGGGDIAFDLARIVSPGGRIVGLDIDEVKLQLARREARARHFSNIEFRMSDIAVDEVKEQFDFIYARFVLTHLRDPAKALARMYAATRPGGVLAVEDIDFRGSFCHPKCVPFERYVELYIHTVQRRGADPNIGPRLPELLNEAGLQGVQISVVQPAGTQGEVKLITPITMENIADAVLAEGLASRREIDSIVTGLYSVAQDTSTLLSVPRVVQAWGYRARP